MGAKAATNEVISKLVSALADESSQVRFHACSALGKMGEKAAKNEVIWKLSNIIEKGSSGEPSNAAKAVEQILGSAAAVGQLKPHIIARFPLSEYTARYFRNISEDEAIKLCFESKNASWLPAAARLVLLKGFAVACIEGKVLIYGSKEPIELNDPGGDFSQKLIESFTDQRNKLYLSFDAKQFEERK
jgi:hypothetical protein